MNFIRLVLYFFALSLAACAPLTAEIRGDVATAIGTEVHIQVGTAAVKQVATAVATHFPTAGPQPTVSPSSYDCAPKFCKDMTACEEAVYKLTVCGQSRLDSDDDGIPCEALCKNENLDAIKAGLTIAAPAVTEAPPESGAEIGRVTRVVDGDTIDVLLAGVNTRIRYLQMNSPERDEACSREATQANAELVAGQTVRLLADEELVDRYDRLLRYVYVGDVLVNRELVAGGWAEVVLYPPNRLHYDEFVRLEQEAAAAGRGCHPTGVFNDGSTTR